MRSEITGFISLQKKQQLIYYCEVLLLKFFFRLIKHLDIHRSYLMLSCSSLTGSDKVKKSALVTNLRPLHVGIHLKSFTFLADIFCCITFAQLSTKSLTPLSFKTRIIKL